jgi:hypothetical protein
VATVNLTGVDALVEAGISPQEFADADRLSVLDVEIPGNAASWLGEALGECGFAVLLTSAMAEGFEEAAGTELPAEARTCLDDNMGRQAATDAMAKFFIDRATAAARTVIGEALVACPGVPTAIIIARSPPEETPETELCLLDFVRDNPDLTICLVRQGRRDPPADRHLTATSLPRLCA